MGEAVRAVKVVQGASLLSEDKVETADLPLFVRVPSFRETVDQEDKVGKAVQGVGVVKVGPGLMVDEEA